MKRTYLIAHLVYGVNASQTPKYRILETILTLDGPRIRVSDQSFHELEQATQFVKELEELEL